jgi:hypothetical protein
VDTVLAFLNNNPVGVAVKVGVAAVLSWVLVTAPEWDVPTVVVIGVTPVIVALIDFFNPLNTRFGVTR